MKISKDYLSAQGWREVCGIMVRFTSPRLGWKEDGTLIIGYHEYPEKVFTTDDLSVAVIGK